MINLTVFLNLVKIFSYFFILIYFYPANGSASESIKKECEKESLELEIYRESYKKVDNDLNLCLQNEKFTSNLGSARDSYVNYTVRYYEQESNLRDIEVAIYQWQIMAANVVLALVIILTIAGVVFSGYQLWRSTRLSKLPQHLIDMELSASKLKLQTSVIGVVVLIVSYAFLLVFTKEIYQLRAVDREPLKNQIKTNDISNQLPSSNVKSEK